MAEKGLSFHPAYEPLFGELPEGVRYVVVTGGRGSGKSYAVSTALGIQMHNFKHRLLFTRYTLTSAKDSVIPEFKEKLDLLGLGSKYEVQKDRIEGPEGRKVIFRGLRSSSGDQSARLKSLKDFSCFILDEAEECLNEDEFDKIDLSIRPNDVHSLIVLVLNPTTKNHWIYKRFFEKRGVMEGYEYTLTENPEPYRIIGDTLYIHTTYIENLDNLADDYLRVIDNLRRDDPTAYTHAFLGKWNEVSAGVILTNWRFAKADEFDWATMDYDGFGLDFGYRDPDALVAIKVLRKQRKLLVRQCLYENGLSTRDLAIKVRGITGRNLVIADDSAARTIADLRGYGVNIRKCGKGKVNDDIKQLKSYEIIISPDSVDLAQELNAWSWLDKASEKAQETGAHCIDPTRYILRTIVKPVGSGKGIQKIRYK